MPPRWCTIILCLLLTGVGCKQRPIIGEIVAVVRDAGIESPVFIEPDGASTLAILRSEEFWKERIFPRLKDQSPAIHSFVDSRKTHFVATYTWKYTTDKTSQYIGTFELRFGNLTRSDAAIILSAIIAAYEEQAAAKFHDAIPFAMISLHEGIQRSAKLLETLPPDSPQTERIRKHVTALERRLAELPHEKPPRQILASRILD